MNILVCTPGRMLQHMDQTAEFEIDNLQMLVLDEADRIMDMGFQTVIDAIIEHLPKERQTLLFSATQTKRVSDLARLSLKDPEYISVHESAASATPSTLQQHYVITPLPEKLNTLYSFIRSNLKSKILVFLSSGKQVRFVYESLRHLQPGIPLLHLLGKQKQTTRLEITTKFSTSQHSCLFATDVVARGLDFPAVDWVLQLDCPEDADTYIHRVGRTARYERNGRAVLFLDPSEEEGMLKRLEHKKVPIERINVRAKKQQSIQNQLQNMCFKDSELKYLGQKAFISYTKSIYLQKDKEIFDIHKLQLEEFAASLGLPGAPKIKFTKGNSAKERKNAPRQNISSGEEDELEEDSAEAPHLKEKKKGGVRTKYDRMFERRNQDVLADHYSKIIQSEGDKPDLNGDADVDEDFLNIKRRHDVFSDSDDNHSDLGNAPDPAMKKRKIISNGNGQAVVIDSKRRERLLKSKKQVAKLKSKGTKLVFDDDGIAQPMYKFEDETQFKQKGDVEFQRAKFLEEERQRVQTTDLADKKLAKEKKRQKIEKRKAREATEREEEEGAQVELAPYNAEPVEETRPTEGRPQKRPKKWFEDESGDEKKVARRKGRVIEAADEPETLEDLEALASGLLG